MAEAAVVKLGGLQERVAVAKNCIPSLLFILLFSGPMIQDGFPLVLPPMVLARVAPSWCPSRLVVHVALVCPKPTLYPCDQQ